MTSQQSALFNKFTDFIDGWNLHNNPQHSMLKRKIDSTSFRCLQYIIYPTFFFLLLLLPTHVFDFLFLCQLATFTKTPNIPFVYFKWIIQHGTFTTYTLEIKKINWNWRNCVFVKPIPFVVAIPVFVVCWKKTSKKPVNE